jgi:hypothetical protein
MKLYNGDTEIVGLTFTDADITPEVFPPLGQEQNASPLMRTFCCNACFYLHQQLNLQALDCICCFYIGGCGISCLGHIL